MYLRALKVQRRAAKGIKGQCFQRFEAQSQFVRMRNYTTFTPIKQSEYLGERQ